MSSVMLVSDGPGEGTPVVVGLQVLAEVILENRGLVIITCKVQVELVCK